MLYDKLPEGESFRLLEIQPGAKRGPLICCLLTVEDLENAPDYECISYVWGDPTDTEEIQCGLGVPEQIPKARHILNKLFTAQKKPPLYPFSITKNLAAALRRLRTRRHRRLVWADAICINQKDNLEKGHQVAHMGKIYAHSRTVYVWLGQDEYYFGVAIRSMDAIYDCCCKLAKLEGIHKSAYDAKLHESDYPPVYLPGGNDLTAANAFLPSTCLYGAIDHFFGHPWFQRVWVIQEVARCQNVQMLSGRLQYSWDLVALAANWCGLACLHEESLFSTFQNLRSMTNAVFMRDKSYKSPESTNFVEFLGRIRMFDATDPRDKVYGVLSWLNDFPPKLSSKFLPVLYPDYTKSVPALYTLVAVRSIKLSQDLGILSHVCHGSSLKEDIYFPSWVPQWDRPKYTTLLSDHDFALDADRGQKHGIDSQLQVQLSSDERSLKLNGIRCGVVSRALNPGCRLASLHREITGDSVLKSPLYGLLRAFTSDLEAGKLHSALSSSADSSTDKRINSCYVTRLIPPWVTPLPENNTLKSSLDNGLRKDIVDANGNTFRFIDPRSENWKLFTTRAGNICFGPECTHEGDIICVLRGGRVPYVLRKKGDHWLFLGECYVGGIMLGEAVSLNENGSWEGEETFELR